MNQASQAGRHARAQQRVKQKDSAVHPANLLTLVLKFISAVVVISFSVYLFRSTEKFKVICSNDGNTCSWVVWYNTLTFGVVPGALGMFAVFISLFGEKARTMSGVWNAITLVAYSANAGRLLTMYSGTVFVDPAYQTVRHAIQTNIAFCFVGISATLARFILHVCVQCGWLKLRCPRWMNMKKQHEDSLHAQPLMDVSSRSNNRAGRPMNPRATRTRTTETRPENATTPVDDPPPPYTSKEHTEVSLTDV